MYIHICIYVYTQVYLVVCVVCVVKNMTMIMILIMVIRARVPVVLRVNTTPPPNNAPLGKTTQCGQQKQIYYQFRRRLDFPLIN